MYHELSRSKVKVTGLKRISIKKRYNSGTDKPSNVKLDENILTAFKVEMG